MRLVTKVTLQATEKDIAPLQNFIGWLEDMDGDVFDACNDTLPIGHDLYAIEIALQELLESIEVD